MGNILWIIFSWLMKIIIVLMIISIIAFFCKFIWLMVTNGGRKRYYYDPRKPWKGGYWTPLLPRIPLTMNMNGILNLAVSNIRKLVSVNVPSIVA